MRSMFSLQRTATRIHLAIALVVIAIEAASVTDMTSAIEVERVADALPTISATADTNESEPVVPPATTMTRHEDADPRWTASLTDALGRFADAGLEAFAVDIHVWTAATADTQCHGYAGIFTTPSTGPRVDLCIDYSDSTLGTHLRHKLILHELAHAWIHTHVADATRHAFMGSRGIESWNGADQTHSSRGTEIAADVIVAALHPDPPADPDDTCGYELITSHTTPFARTDTCTASWTADAA